jgi:N-acetylglucosamine-6-sulfatase
MISPCTESVIWIDGTPEQLTLTGLSKSRQNFGRYFLTPTNQDRASRTGASAKRVTIGTMATRREWLASLGVPALRGLQAPRPNLIFVLIDDLRFDELGCLGHPFVRTPNIDRIAREGAVFGNAFATTPLCSPSRASFLTGQYAHSHGVTDNTDRSPLSHRMETFPRRLQNTGYETGYIGKWHMGVDDAPRPGFDYWLSFRGQGHYNNPELNENGRTAVVPGYVTDIFNLRAADFIRRKRSQPFFLYLSHKAVHPDIVQNADGSVIKPPGGGFEPPQRYRNAYAREPLPRRPNYLRPPEGKPALLRTAGRPEAAPTDDETIRNRLRLLMPVEDGIGQLFRALEETGQAENTAIVFAGDNGYFYGEHGLGEERRLAYEESARVPLLMRYPRLIRPGSKIGASVLNIDLAPTMLELAGIPGAMKTHGRSWLPLFQGRGKDWRESFLIEYFSDRVMPRVVNMGYQAVRTRRWKYIRYSELTGMDELYDLQSDPYELKNRIGDPASATTLAALKRELERLIQESA